MESKGKNQPQAGVKRFFRRENEKKCLKKALASSICRGCICDFGDNGFFLRKITLQ